ncbi:unnamed protein product [Linum trigynum]|uniref:Uncharacterized protein n=1 Tax=Linum trigynum TaxID=586398 RepID=A0AAV2D5N9_9ROSI
MQGGTATKTRSNPTGKLPEGLATEIGPETDELAGVRFPNLPPSIKPSATNQQQSIFRGGQNQRRRSRFWIETTNPATAVSKFGEKTEEHKGLQATKRMDERRRLNGLEATSRICVAFRLFVGWSRIEVRS